RQLPRRRLDRGASLEEHRRRIPRSADELVAGAVRHSRLDDAVAEADLLLLHVHRHRRLRRPADLALEPLDVLLGGEQAGDAAHGHLAALEVGGAHFKISLTSVTTPVIAAAATIAGLMSNVRPVGLPCRPMKFRLLDDALISRPCSLSSFMPRHMEQPALRHWKPAARKISFR